MRAKPVGMLWMMSAGWQNRPPEVPRRVLEGLPEGCLGRGMNKFTLLADRAGGFRGVAAGVWDDGTSRRHRLAGIHHPGGERCHVFGVGEGPAEAKQDGIGVIRKRFDRELVTEPWLLDGSTQAGVRNKMRNNDLRFGYGHASVALRSPS